MALGQTPITIIGNLTDNPELRYTPTGVAVISFTVAATERTLNKQSGQYEDSGALFLRVNIWREQAEHAAESLIKGSRVVVTGTLRQRGWEDKEGNKRTSYEIQGEEVAASLRFATAVIKKSARTGGPAPEDPWATGPQAPADDEPPF